MMNRHGLHRGTFYHAPDITPAHGKSPSNRNTVPLSYGSQRRRITVQGVVQSAGFHSFVYALAQQWGLSGHTLDDNSDVIIEVQGSETSIENFLDSLLTNTPPRSHIAAISTELIPASSEESSFVTVQHTASQDQPGRDNDGKHTTRSDH